MQMVIKMFRGELSFLSSMYPCKITMLDNTYPSVENAFQALKCKEISDRDLFLTVSPGKAKKLGKKIIKRDDWKSIQLIVMEYLLGLKFSDEKLLARLKGIDDELLVETNTWCDNYWGDCMCPKCADIIGENHLGLLLQKIKYKK